MDSSATAQPNWMIPLGRADGHALCTASEALLKGFLESEFDVHLIVGVRRAPFEGVFEAAESEAPQLILSRNGLRVVAAFDAVRAIELAAQEASRGRRAVVLLANDELDQVVVALAELAQSPLGDGAGICIVLEDNPFAVQTTCPRRVCRRSGITAIEPCDLRGLRDGCDAAFRLSRATRRPAALIAHISLLRSGATLAMAPNRQVARVDHDAWLRRRHTTRVGDSADPLQIVRRLELNRLEHLPSPGEREQYGFIALGACAVAVRHMLDELSMTGRVPLLRLTVTEPLDDAAVARLLERCHHVIVVEARPGSVAPRIVAIAESLRVSEGVPAHVWWDSMPPGAGDVEPLGINDGLRTSLLTRRVIRLLHEVRPGLQLTERLARIPPGVATIELPRRGLGIGLAAGFDLIAAEIRLAAEIIAERAFADGMTRAIVGERARASTADIVCTVEVWDARRFAREGTALVRQAASERAPRVVVVCSFSLESPIDVERFARASVGVDGESKLAFARIDVNDREAMREAFLTSAGSTALTIIIAQDGPPPRFDVAALERTAREIDLDGFLRFQRFILPADNACELRDPGLATQIARGLLRGSDPLRPEPLIERSIVPGARGLFVRLESLLEQVEIIRTRPPAGIDALRTSVRVTPPRPAHADQGIWRVHIAGFRGDAPGAAGQLLAEAGRSMGFQVEWTHLGVPVGPGRRAWSQLLFTRMDESITSESASCTIQIPYGEADLVIGIDPVETIRAIATDAQLRVADPARTALVANTSPLEDQIDEPTVQCASRLAAIAQATTLASRCVLIDIVSESRSIFLSDRQSDLIAVGIAFQRGFIPLSIDALEDSARRMEVRGYARSFEAIQLGRLLAVRTGAGAIETAGVTAAEPTTDETLRLARRVSADRQLGGRRERSRGQRLRKAVVATLGQLSPLASTRHGREAMRDLATAMRRCEMWGGFDYATQYAQCITALRADSRTDEGCELARLLTLPLAECFLIRDIWYVGALTTSLDQSHRIRDTLGVRLARGDEIRRRYLHRLEVRLASRKWVVEFRSSDWPDRILRATMQFVPRGMRGTIQSRGARERMIALLHDAARDHAGAHAWLEFARRMHDAAVDGSIRSMTGDEIEEIAVRVGAIHQ